MNRKRIREQNCIYCKQPMKYCGSRIYYCKQCKLRCKYDKVPDIKTDKKGNVVRNFIGKLIHRGTYTDNIISWKSSR